MIAHHDSPRSQEFARDHYHTRLKNLSEASSQLTLRYRTLFSFELGLSLLLAIVFYVLYTHRVMDPMLATAIYAAGSSLVLSIPIKLLLQISSELLINRKLIAYYEGRVQRLDDTWKGNGDDGSEFSVANHPYCGDLDIFGNGSLFEYLCSAQTGAGREWLANALLAPASLAVVMERQRASAELRYRADLREYFASAGASSVRSFDGKSLSQWCHDDPVLFSAASRIAGACLCVINVVVIALALFGGLSPEIPLLSLAVVGLYAATLHRKVTQVVERTSSVVEYELNLLLAYTQQLRKEQFQCALLRRAADSFCLLSDRCQRRLLRFTWLLKWHSDPAFTYFSYLSLWGVLLAMMVEKQRVALGPDLARMAAALGELEGLSSLAAYAFEHSDYPFPSFVSEETSAVIFVADSLGHPLIGSAVCVRNPVRINGGNRLLLVSGSNMSGKSTYLRAIGINYVLARAGAPVCAESLHLSIFSLGTSMYVQDSLADGKSRFLAEVSLVRQVLDRAEREPVLFLFDELFSGTNSEDRRAGAAGAIAHLLHNHASGLLTTHDLALSELFSAERFTAKNVYFIDQVSGDAMTFDYRIRDGIAPHTNGAVILNRLGIL